MRESNTANGSPLIASRDEKRGTRRVEQEKSTPSSLDLSNVLQAEPIRSKYIPHNHLVLTQHE